MVQDEFGELVDRDVGLVGQAEMAVAQRFSHENALRVVVGGAAEELAGQIPAGHGGCPALIVVETCPTPNFVGGQLRLLVLGQIPGGSSGCGTFPGNLGRWLGHATSSSFIRRLWSRSYEN
jgi:hypothetical protein